MFPEVKKRIIMYFFFFLQSVFTKAYDKNTGSIESTLTLELRTDTLLYLESTKWWCQVEYTILDDPTVLTVEGDPAAITFEDRK